MSEIVVFRPADEGLVGRRRDRDGLLNEPVEQLAAAARVAPVETEGEFVQIVVQVLRTDPALMRAQQPAFQQRHDSMHPAVPGQ